MDVEVSPVAKHIMSVVRPLSRSIAIDLAFVIEGQEESELPERLLGGVRLHRIDLGKFKSPGLRSGNSVPANGGVQVHN